MTLDRLLHDGVALDTEGSVADAIKLYEQVLAERPDMMSASRHLAFDYWQLGDAGKAVAVLRTALKAGTPTTGAQVQLATYLAETAHADEARQMLAPLASRDDADLETLNAFGIASARAGRPAEALAAFRRSLTVDPRNAMSHENIGTIELQAGHLDAARAAFERALQSNADSSQAHAGLAMIALKRGDRDAAIVDWRRAVDLDPTNYDALYDLGLQLLRAGRPAEARPYLDRFVSTAPRSLYGRDIEEIRAVLTRLR